MRLRKGHEFLRRDANCRGADFSRSILRGSTLAGADLTNAIFENTVVADADFTGARLDGVLGLDIAAPS